MTSTCLTEPLLGLTGVILTSRRQQSERMTSHRFPDTTAQVFKALDLDGDGIVDHDEWHDFKEAHASGWQTSLLIAVLVHMVVRGRLEGDRHGGKDGPPTTPHGREMSAP